MKNTIITILAALLLLPSCRTLKTVAHDVRDSVVVVAHDSTIYRYVDITHDSTIIKDSVIGIAGSNVGFDISFNSTSDTIVKKGPLSIRRTVDKGRERIECNSDSLTIVVMDLQIQIRFKTVQNDTLQSRIDRLEKSHLEVTVKEQSLSWWGRLWASIEKYFAWFGLICLIFLICKLVAKFK